MKIFLDDIRDPDDIYPPGHEYHGNWNVCRGTREFYILISQDAPTVISFDNDLPSIMGGKKGRPLEGKDMLARIIDDVLDGYYPCPKLLVHSANVPAGNYMRGVIQCFERFLAEKDK